MKKKRDWLGLLKNARAADRPNKKEKYYQPPGSLARKFGQVLFWTVFGFMFLVFLVTVLFRPSEEMTEEVEAVPEKPVLGIEGTDFAKKFAAAYFSWVPDQEGWEERKNKLAPLLARGLDEQAGVIEADQEWTSSPGTMRVLQLKETGNDRALITLEVEQVLKKEKETKRAIHHFSVPVAYAGGFGVYDLPSFTAVATAAEVERQTLEGGPVEAEVDENIQNFLSTFFQSYAVDSPDKLSYFLEGETVQGLEGAVEFVELRDSTVVLGEKTRTYEAAADVIMAEPQTNTRYLVHYRVAVKEEGGRYVVTKLNEGVE